MRKLYLIYQLDKVGQRKKMQAIAGNAKIVPLILIIVISPYVSHYNFILAYKVCILLLANYLK